MSIRDKSIVQAGDRSKQRINQIYKGDDLKRLSDDREAVLKVAKDANYEFGLLEYLSPRLRADRVIVTAAVHNYGHDYKYASEELRKDHTIAFIAVTENRHFTALAHCPDSLREDKDFVKSIVRFSKKAAVLQYASEKLTSDEDFMADMCDIDKQAIYYATGKFAKSEDCRELAKFLIEGDGLLIIGSQFVCDKEMVMLAINTFPVPVLSHASMELRADKEVVLHAIKCLKKIGQCPTKLHHQAKVPYSVLHDKEVEAAVWADI